MKKTIMSLAVVSALLSGSAMAALTNGQADNSASTATLNFSGKVTSTLCQVNTSDMGKTIQLGEASLSGLNGGGQSPFISFDVGLVNCDPSVSDISYVLSDSNGSPVSGATTSDYLVPKSTSTSASGVGVYIADSEHNPISIGGNKTLNVIKDASGALSQQTIPLVAYMRAVGGRATAGTVDATGVMTIKATAAAAGATP